MSPYVIGLIVVVVVALAAFLARGRARPAPAAADERAAALKLPVSTSKIGPYTVSRVINAGQYVVTCAAKGDDGAEVTLRIPSRASLDDADELKRFGREAIMLDAIAHPNVARKIGEGRIDDRGRKVPYMVLEPLEGKDFGDFLAERAPLPVGDAVAIMGQIASALEAVHGKEIVHRNLNPDALRIGNDGKVTLYNFGVARGATMQTITIQGQIVGSVDYISPEQIKGGKVDARTDLYALGVLGYRLLTGKSPFVYPNIAALVKQKGELEGPHPQRANPDVPSDLDRIVSQLMSSDAARRPGPAGRLRRDLEQIRAIPERE